MPRNNFNLEENLYDLVLSLDDKRFPEIEEGHLWDFRSVEEDALLVVKSQGTRVPFPIPSCEKEFQRFQQVNELRKLFHQEVMRVFGMEPPKECLNRWLFNQLAVPRSEDEITVFLNDDKPETTEEQPTVKGELSQSEPLLRCPSIARDSKVLHAQLLENLPAVIILPWGKKNDPSSMREAYSKYLDKALEWLDEWKNEMDEHTCDSKDKEIRKSIIELLQRIDETNRADELRKLKEEAVTLCHSSFFSSKFSQMIDPIVNQVIQRAQTLSQQISELTSTPSEELVTITTGSRNERIFQYNENEVTISGVHYLKLQQLYKIHSGFNKEEVNEKEYENAFHRALYVLARRYATFFGENEGAAFHAAAPESAFEVMRNSLGVVQELFASPFNCHFAKFCSAFPDIDCWFGSCGSFFDFLPHSGSYEVGPPYTIEVMDQTAQRLEKVLNESTGPLSFIVFVPEWKEPVAEYHKIMESSSFLRMEFVMGGNDHAYVVGDQHTSNTRYFSLPFRTCVYILQNKEGQKEWPVSEQLREELEASLHNPIERQKKKSHQNDRSQHRDSSRWRRNDDRDSRGRYNRSTERRNYDSRDRDTDRRWGSERRQRGEDNRRRNDRDEMRDRSYKRNYDYDDQNPPRKRRHY